MGEKQTETIRNYREKKRLLQYEEIYYITSKIKIEHLQMHNN